MDVNGPCILLSRQLDPPLHPAMEPPWTAHPFSDMQISFRPAHRSTCYLLGPECLPIPFLCLAKSSSFFKIYGKCYLFCDTPPQPPSHKWPVSPLLSTALCTYFYFTASTAVSWLSLQMDYEPLEDTIYSLFTYLSPAPNWAALYIVGAWYSLLNK